MTEQNNPNQEEMLYSTEVNDNEKVAGSASIQEDIQTSEPVSFEFAGFFSDGVFSLLDRSGVRAWPAAGA